MPTTYPPLSIGAARRLAMFRAEALKPGWVRPMNWRDVRFATLRSDTGFGQGSDDKTAIWHTQSGADYFRAVRYADEVYRGITHIGWFTDADEHGGKETARGIVASLSHGRFIAGYELSMNDERVYFAQVFTNETDAARMADEHARVIGEQESEYQSQWREGNKLDSLIDEKLADVRELHEKMRRCIGVKNSLRKRAPASVVLGVLTDIKECRSDVRDILGDVRAFRLERKQYPE